MPKRRKPADEENVSHAAANLERAESLLEAGKIDEALFCVQRAAKLDAKNPDVFDLLGTLFIERDEMEKAGKMFDRAIELDPDHVSALLNKAFHALEYDADPETCLALVDHLLHLAGLLDPKPGEDDDAVPEIEVMDASELVDVYALRAHAHWDLGELEEALRACEAGLRFGPDDKELLLDKGSILLEMGHEKRAVKPLERAVNVDPEFADAHYSLGLAYERIGNARLRDKHFARTAELDDKVKPHLEMSEAEFSKLAERAMQLLSPQVKKVIAQTKLVLAPVPKTDDPGFDEQNPYDPRRLLNLGHVSKPSGQRSFFADAQPPETILLYRRNLERECIDSEDIVDQIQFSLTHEIGHRVLGLSDEELEAQGIG